MATQPLAKTGIQKTRTELAYAVIDFPSSTLKIGMARELAAGERNACYCLNNVESGFGPGNNRDKASASDLPH